MQTWLKVLISILSALGLLTIAGISIEDRRSEAETEKMLAVADKLPVQDEWKLWKEKIVPDPFLMCLKLEPCNIVQRTWDVGADQLTLLEYKDILDESGWDLQLDERSAWNEACKVPREQVSEPDDYSDYCTWVTTDGDYEVEVTIYYHYQPTEVLESSIGLEISR